MSLSALRTEERIGLGVAVVAHVALFAWLAWQRPAPPPPPPERMSVTLSPDVGLTSTAPRPAPEAAPDKAPEQGEPAPKPQEVAQAEPPKPVIAPPRPSVTARTPISPARPAPHQAAPARPADRQPVKAGASRFDQAFAKGVPGAQGKNTSVDQGAAEIGQAVRASLAGSISRQLKPKWVAPEGIDSEKLVTILSWDLNPDGTLAGEPRLVRQEGVTASNRAQAARHVEQAKRAVKLASPFILPPQYYAVWKHISLFRFDRKLSQ